MNEPASAERVLWLHVGTHKTGTTSLQYALRHKCAALAKAGVTVWPGKNAWRLANLFLRPTVLSLTRASGRATPPTLAEIRAAPELLTANLGDFRRMIISSEQFCMLREGLEGYALATALRSVFDQIIPVVALRNLADWKASREDELRRKSMWERQKSLPDDQSANGDWYYDRDAIIAFWKEIGPLRVVDYDAACAKDGSILPAMAEALDQPGLFADQEVWLNTRQAQRTDRR